MTVSDLIKSSLRLIGAIAAGETPSAAESADGLVVLNDLLEAWSVEGFLIYKTTRESVDLVAAQSSYTFGSGGNFSTARPMRIQEVRVEKDDCEYPITIIEDIKGWADIVDKTQTAALPTHIFIDGNFPTDTIKVWPVPTEVNSLIFYSQKPLTAYAATSETVSLPPGYSRALRYNLAIELVPEFGGEVSPLVLQTAKDSKASIKKRNMRPVMMKSDAAGLSSNKPYFDINTGNF